MPQVILLEKVAPWFVVVMGVGTVFIGLICIILICAIMGLIFRNHEQKEVVPVKKTEQSVTWENRQEILAAVCAAAAEDMGTDVSAIRVISFKKM